MNTFNVTEFMLAMGLKLPMYRDVPITTEAEFDMAMWFANRLKPFLFKPTNERVRITYVGYRHMTLEILK